MSIHYLLFWLLLTAAFGKSDLGMLGVVVAWIGLVGTCHCDHWDCPQALAAAALAAAARSS